MTQSSAALITDDRFLVTWHWPTPKDNRALPVHGNGNRYARKEIVGRWRTLAKYICLEAGCPNWGKAVVYYRFYKPSNRAIDQLNHAHRVKSVVDGVYDAGLLHDDSDKYLVVGGPMESHVDKESPRIEIDFVRKE